MTRALVALQPQGSRAPLFLVHGLGGTVLPLVALARSLAPDRPCFGLQARGVDDGCEPLARVEAIAAAHLEEIMASRPRGPYRIAGWSFGGLVALAMAVELRRAGHDAAVAVLDTLALLDGGPDRSSDPPSSPVAAAHARARDRYKPPPFEGPIALFRAAIASPEAEATPALGWDRVARGSFEVQRTEGDHTSLLQPPHVAALARGIEAWLARIGG